jgi:predicted nuclease of predicted toxin-antitoxin system
MKVWLDAQLSPEMSNWLEASDLQIFTSAKQAGVVLITKDSNFSTLLGRFGPPRR